MACGDPGLGRGRLGSRGVTLTELMVATAVVSVGILGLVATFSKIQRAVQSGKNKTLASNLAQEKMQIVKQQTYFRVIPTMSPSFLADGTAYDTANFPPETILEGGISFQRYTCIQVVTENSGVINVLPPTTPDTGMRQITVTVEWQEGKTTRSLAISAVMANPNTVEANSVFQGQVLDKTTNMPISGALVNVAENAGWRDSSDSGGNYSIHLSPGNFNLIASARGYFTQYLVLSVQPSQTVTQNFTLPAISSGSVTGTAWLNPGVLISQIVAQVPVGGYNAEYVELYNPTPNAVTVNGALNFNYHTDHQSDACLNIPLTYVNNAVPAYSYYIVANTTTFTINGTILTADAYFTDSANLSCSAGGSSWNPPNVRDLMHPGHSGTWWLTGNSGNVVDAVGWDKNGTTYIPSGCLGSCYPTQNGLQPGEELVRASSPTYFGGGYGRAYNSQNNSVDFTTSTSLAYSPYSTASGTQTVIAGVPAVGAVVSANDGLSNPVSAVSVGSPPVARFALTQVATGTWTVLITSGAYELENDTVTIAATGSAYVFPSSTTLVTGAATAGFVSGSVVDAYGSPISAPSAISVSAAGQSVIASASTGRYLLRLSPGTVDVTANSGFANTNYVSVSSLAVSVSAGQVTSGVNFVLSQGGRLTGWVTRDGVNGLQGVTVVAADVNGNVQDQEVSDVHGYFTTVNMATGTYTLNIPLDTTDVSSPTFVSANVQLGTTVSVGTFTISGALGAIQGTVTASGKPISTGVLIVVTTGTITMPPNISSQSLTSAAYYLTSSLEDGTFSVSVRQSTAPPYNIYGYYSTISNTGTVSTTVQLSTGAKVLAGQTVSGRTLSW